MIGDKLTIAEAAAQLSVSRQRMHQLIEENNLATEMVHKRLKLIHPKELLKIPGNRPPGRKSKKVQQKRLTRSK